MAMQELTIKRRTETGTEVAKRLRRAGAVPAVVYDGQKAETVTVDPKAVLRMIHGREGTTQLLTLKFDGEAGNGARLAIIRELQFDPVTEQLLHVDLQEVSADRAITVHVTVRPVGEAAGRACFTCSFQAEDVVLLHLLQQEQPDIPVLFLETGYHFPDLLQYRDRLVESRRPART